MPGPSLSDGGYVELFPDCDPPKLDQDYWNDYNQFIKDVVFTAATSPLSTNPVWAAFLSDQIMPFVENTLNEQNKLARGTTGTSGPQLTDTFSLQETDPTVYSSTRSIGQVLLTDLPYIRIGVDDGDMGAVGHRSLTVTNSSANVPTCAAVQAYAAPKVKTAATNADLLAMSSSASFGDEVLLGSNDMLKKMIWTGRTWQCPGETFEMQAGEQILEGHCVMVGAVGAGADRFQDKVYKQNRSGSNRTSVVGVLALSDASADEFVTVAYAGIWKVLVVVDAVNGLTGTYIHSPDNAQGAGMYLNNTGTAANYAIALEAYTAVNLIKALLVIGQP